jgi:hypothetical protein
MKIFFNLVYGLLVIALVGCAAQPTLTPLNSKDPIVVYHRSGGFAGFDETWSIMIDGRIDHTGRGAGQAGQLTPDRLNRLLAALRSIDLTSIKDSYIGANTCCDRFIYEITINLDGKTKSINTIDAAEGEPTALITLRTAIQAALP